MVIKCTLCKQYIKVSETEILTTEGMRNRASEVHLHHLSCPVVLAEVKKQESRVAYSTMPKWSPKDEHSTGLVL